MRKILLSAFAFAPNAGSEAGVGWHWATTLAEKNNVTVVTDASRRELIEKHLPVGAPANLKIVYFRPFVLRHVPLNSWTAQVLYSSWQYMLYLFVRRLHSQERFDLAIHITYGVFRHPSFLGLLGIPFLFGPLGGGEDAPWSLKCGIHGREKGKEAMRTLLNVAAKCNPMLWLSYSTATLLLVKTRETRQALPTPYRSRAIVHREIGIRVPKESVPSDRSPGEVLEVLFVGRLLGWKGVHLAVRAVAVAVQRGVACRLTIVGRGPYRHELERLVRGVSAGEYIQLIDHLPQQDLFAQYKKAHCFLFPSLHDSSGNVVLEAQAFGLPVICLDLGGPPTLVTADSAFVVGVRGKTESVVVSDLSDSLECLARDEARRRAMAAAAISNARGMTWESCVDEALRFLDSKSRGGPRNDDSLNKTPGEQK